MLKITYNADLQKLTTFGVPARCGRLVEFDTVADLREAHKVGLFKGPAFVLGGGSNVLFTNGQYEGTVLHHKGRRYTLRSVGPNEVEISVEAGMPLDELCRFTAQAGLWGLENLSGIPGTVGGAAVQNAGAYGAEIADCITGVEVFQASDVSAKSVRLPVRDCRYGYRTSIFKKAPYLKEGWQVWLIHSVSLRLSLRPKPRLDYAGLREAVEHIPALRLKAEDVRQAVLEIRKQKLPNPGEVGSAGSFFQNPVLGPKAFESVQQRWIKMQEEANQHLPEAIIKPEITSVPSHAVSPTKQKLSAAWLIDKAGCKNMSCGEARLWPLQPLVIVNPGKATGTEVVELEKMVLEKVRRCFGVALRPEVIHIE